ncbi:hypothetical protein C0J52_19308 [Blattella germanica]|nr:hypothetical protein C0J52_19308 [Blattella germanica]
MTTTTRHHGQEDVGSSMLNRIVLAGSLQNHLSLLGGASRDVGPGHCRKWVQGDGRCDHTHTPSRVWEIDLEMKSKPLSAMSTAVPSLPYMENLSNSSLLREIDLLGEKRGEDDEDQVLRNKYTSAALFGNRMFQVLCKGGGEFSSGETLITRLTTQRWLDVGEDWTEDEHRSSHSVMRYEYRVTCDAHYYGAGCANLCRPRDDNFGHYKCSPTGDRVCLSGWQGDYCTKREFFICYGLDAYVNYKKERYSELHSWLNVIIGTKRERERRRFAQKRWQQGALHLSQAPPCISSFLRKPSHAARMDDAESVASCRRLGPREEHSGQVGWMRRPTQVAWGHTASSSCCQGPRIFMLKALAEQNTNIEPRTGKILIQTGRL